MSLSKKNPNAGSGCFFSIFGRLNCGGNQPTHPSPPEGILEKNSNSTKDNNVSNNNCSEKIGAVVVRSKSNPGIVARLMGLDTLPECNTASKPPLLINDSLSRSKSLNSLHFVPDFNPAKPSFHRRVRTSLSASFHEPGHGFLSTIVENSEIDDSDQMKNIVDKGCNETTQKKTCIEKAVVSKGNECQKTRKSSEIKKNYIQEHYYRGNCTTCRTKTSNKLVKNTSVIRDNVGSNNTKKNNNSSRENCGNQRSNKLVVNNINNKVKNVKISSKSVSRKNKGGDNNVQSDDVQLSRSPISVLDHHQLEFDSPSREDTNATQTTSNLRSRSTPKPDMPPQEIERKSRKKDRDNFTNNIASKNKVATEEDAEYFDNLSAKICALAEDQLCKDLTSHVTKYDLFKAHFIEELCNDIGQHMLDFLLDELICEYRCLCCTRN